MMNPSSTICLHCLRARGEAHVCPHCGTAADEISGSVQLLRPGTVLHGKYLIGRTLGQGGFAVTYLGVHLDLGIRVAIKEYFPTDLADRDRKGSCVLPRRTGAAPSRSAEYFQRGLERFIEEGRNIGLCHQPAPHPNLVRVTDYFEENGTAYLVMDYVEGVSLEDYLSKQPDNLVSEADAVRILMPVLDGLRAVHDHGFYHRDVKPANIYLSHNGPVILLDFGSARMSLHRETQTQTLFLTPGYAPPEQYSNKGEQGGWTDVYGCAATLYRCVSGVDPISAADRMAGAELPPPSAIPGRKISAPLESLILWGLTLDRGKRPQTVSEFQQALDAVCMRGPASGAARGPARTLKPAQFPMKRPAMLGAIVLLMVIALAITWIALSNRAGIRAVASIRAQALEIHESMDGTPLETYAPLEFVEAKRLLDIAERLKTQNPRQAVKRYEAAIAQYTTAVSVARYFLEHEQQEKEQALTHAREAALEARKKADIPEVRAYASAIWKTAEADLENGGLQDDAEEAIRYYRAARERFNEAVVKAYQERVSQAEIGQGARDTQESSRAGAVAPENTLTVAGIALVWVPPGSFIMGSPDYEKGRWDIEGPQRHVFISRGFWLGKYPVTQAQWHAVTGHNPSVFKGDEQCPVENVSWNDVQQFLRTLNAGGEGVFRLPTEAEWEYACRAGASTAYSYGHDPEYLGNYAWYSANSDGMTHPVGRKRPNFWGLHDMHGNVWEWCQDWFAPYASGAATDPQGPPSGAHKVLRGGSWKGTAGDCRAADRVYIFPDSAGAAYGFRVVCAP